ncbi:MAG TPA: Ig-like domain-containing protein [Solirubrobacteraceae bacterium]|jgi:WD40 repeat protein
MRGRILGLTLAGALAAACLFAPAALALGQVAGSPFTTGTSPSEVAFSPTGKTMATADAGVDESVEVSTFTVNESSDAVAPGQGSPFSADQIFGSTIAFSPDGTELALAGAHLTCGGSMSILAVNQATGALSAAAHPGSSTVVNSVAWGPNGFIALGGEGSCLDDDPLQIGQFNEVSSTYTGFAPPALPAANANMPSVALSPTTPFLATANGHDNTVSIFSIDYATGGMTEIAGSPFFSGGTNATQVAFNAAGTMLAVANASGGAELFTVNQATGALTAVGTVDSGALTPVIAFGHNLLAVASTVGAGETSFYAIDQVSGQAVALPGSLKIPDISSVALSPADKLLAIAQQGSEHQVQVWDTGYRYAGPIVLGSPSYETQAGAKSTVSAADGLLGPASVSSMPAGDTLSVVSAMTQTPHGEVSIDSDGSFAYVPDPGFVGTDTFHYTVSDGGDDYATGTAAVQVTGPVISAPATLDFGAQMPAAAGLVRWLTVTNTGTDPSGTDPLRFTAAATISAVAGASDFSIPAGDDHCAGQTLAANASCEIGVSFGARVLGSESATLALGDNNAVAGAQSVSLTGSGTPAPNASNASTTAPATTPAGTGPPQIPAASTAPPSLGKISCAVSRRSSHAVVRCSTAHSAPTAKIATIVVKRGSTVLARGTGHLTGDHISASLRLRRALRGTGGITVTITVSGLLEGRVVRVKRT